MNGCPSTYNKIGFLPSSTLKIIACVLMAIDHIGFFIFPGIIIFRIIGRLAFPLFAFFIAEGCKYSKNKSRRLEMIAAIGGFFVLFYYIYEGELYGNVFLTFSLSIALIYLLQALKKWTFAQFKAYKLILSALAFGAALAAIYVFSRFVHFEYGYRGMLVPVFVSLFDTKDVNAPNILKKLDCHITKLICFTLGLLLLCINANFGLYQYYCLISVLLVAFYNGQPGNKKFKYAFYIFYPAHIVVLQGIAILISLIE